MASRAASSPKTRNQKKAGKTTNITTPTEQKTRKSGNYKFNVADFTSPASSTPRTKKTDSIAPEQQSTLHSPHDAKDKTSNKCGQLSKEVPHNEVAKPQDECGDIAGMLRQLLSRQQQMMTTIQDLQEKVLSLTDQNAQLSEKLLSIVKVNNTINTNDPCIPGSTVNQDNTNHILKILMEDREKAAIISACKEIKSNLALAWNDLKKKREKHFRNFIKNVRKAELYETWLHTSPDYIPLKYRPKRVPGELPRHTEIRITRAKHEYLTDIVRMSEYADHHQEKFEAFDELIKIEIKNHTSTDEYIGGLIAMWTEEIRIDEVRANELWDKNAKFLSKMKFEDENSAQTQLADITLQEKLQNRIRSNKHHSKHKPDGVQCDINLPQQLSLNKSHRPPYIPLSRRVPV